MKDTRPIEVQVAELTDRQKKNIKMIYRITLIAVIICFAACAVFVVNAAFKFTAWKDAEADLIPYSSFQYILSPERSAAEAAEAEAFQTFQDALLLMTIVSGVLFVALLVILIWQKVAHPYYSEKKYKYIRKTSL